MKLAVRLKLMDIER